MNLQRCLKILELESASTIQEAKRAYKDLVRVWHPDRFANNPRLKKKAGQKLREINLAYKYVRDYLESNQDRELSKSKHIQLNQPFETDAASNTGNLENHRPAENAHASSENQDPPAARFVAAVSKTAPRTSFAGRYVLFAFLCIVVAISALIVYFWSHTDKIASKTRGIASEVMESIVDKLESNSVNQKKDPPVQRAVPVYNGSGNHAESEKKFEIHLDSGSIILTEAWWEENNMIVYKVNGGSMGIERSRVKKIVKR